MSFTSPVFLFAFLPLTVIVYQLARSTKLKNIVWIAAGLLFYAFGDLRLLPRLRGSCLLHEGAAPVEVLVDEELMTRPLLGVHPCDNTATLWITPQQLSLFLSSRGNAVTFAAI